MTVKDAQVRKLRMEMKKHGKIGLAAMRTGMNRKTARKYESTDKLPSELRKPRDYRTRKDPFEQDWLWVESLLKESPGLEAKIIFEGLQRKAPGRYQDGQLRTLQRHIKQWRALSGPDKEVFFPQEHRPGEAIQLDFTEATSLQIRIAGVVFAHLLCHVVLPYSNWRHVTVCLSESFLAIRKGLQGALYMLGHVPKFVQTDNSTAATHQLSKKNKKRGFNEDYITLTRHFGITPRTTGVGKKEQNGDVEAANGALKRRLEQELLMRGNREFSCKSDYEKWLADVVDRNNRGRKKRLDDERAVMRPLHTVRLPEFTELDVKVTSWSTIRVARCAYSVPSRLIGERVRVRLYETRIEVYFESKLLLQVERSKGRAARIDYRHVIWSMVQKPGAFAQYRHREELFPSLVFRQAYDAIGLEHDKVIQRDLHYLRILHLAATTMESGVEKCLAEMLKAKRPIDIDALKEQMGVQLNSVAPSMTPFEPEVASYDQLLDDAGLEAAE